MFGRRPFLELLALNALGPACSQAKDVAAEPLKIAAAADLTGAFKEIGDAFEQSKGKKSVFTFGSTGLLTKQIKEGAPFDVFAAANQTYLDELIAAKAVTASSKQLYARGRIVLWTSASSKVELTQLSEPRFSKIAIANPEHAPYGKAAAQALTKLNLWDVVKPKLVYGENVQQALQYAESGNADAAIVALSLVINAKGSYSDIDGALHEPIDQALGVCEISRQKSAAQDFVDFVTSEAGRAIMRRYGFLLPGEAVTAR
jgi:molybdate transport system substrate-binding protein